MALADLGPYFHRPVMYIVARLEVDGANNHFPVERTCGEIGKGGEMEEEVVLPRT